MKDQLTNPVYYALLSGDAHLSFGTADVKFFDEQVSPFAGFSEEYHKGFDDLYDLLPPGRKILHAIPQFIKEPKGWKVIHEIKGLQFVFTATTISTASSINLVPLDTKNIEEMMQLTALTKPGPFGPRTIEFGNYFGIFENEKLVAMAGQRLHVFNYTEISAVCTHPDHLGKGYAGALMHHQLNFICDHGQIPFLHVRENNLRAIALYERLGFTIQRPMNFYLLKRQELS